MATATGVFPVFNNVFKVKTSASDTTKKTIAEMESFSVSVDGTLEEWTPMEAEGWGHALMTGKKITISMSGKRSIGDTGNDYIAGLAWKTGQDCNSEFEWTFPSGATLTMPCVIDVKTPGGGDSTNVDKLEFDIHSNGKPTFTEATAGGG